MNNMFEKLSDFLDDILTKSLSIEEIKTQALSLTVSIAQAKVREEYETKVEIHVPVLGKYRINPNHLMAVKRLIHNGEKIKAIKLFREYTGLGLKEAKEFVEQEMPKGE